MININHLIDETINDFDPSKSNIKTSEVNSPSFKSPSSLAAIREINQKLCDGIVFSFRIR